MAYPGTEKTAGVETCGLFIFVGIHASISVPPWNLKVIRPSAWMVTVSIMVSQSFSSNSVRASNSCTSNINAPMASVWASRAVRHRGLHQTPILKNVVFAVEDGVNDGNKPCLDGFLVQMRRFP